MTTPIVSEVSEPFQFPSNGKAYPKIGVGAGMPPPNLFQFPSNGKAYPKLLVVIGIATLTPTSFNSLQTGKRIQSSGRQLFRGYRVFQFPSNGKAYPKISKKLRDSGISIQFQFPSNGKAYPKSKTSMSVYCFRLTFQFPSNGKAYPKSHSAQERLLLAKSFNSLQTGKRIQSKPTAWSGRNKNVSIPFKRESVSKGCSATVTAASPRTVSIPFKRESVSKGEALSSTFRLQYMPVSIPFKRESVSKDSRGSRVSCMVHHGSFNSLQTGKRIQRVKGAVYSVVGYLCFNSLQTGKRIQSRQTRPHRRG